MTKDNGYYRNPSIKKDQIVFVSDDDLWIVSKDGGKSQRLTSGVGVVDSPSYSPNGEWIAFTAYYEGHPEVYIIPSEGGQVKRLTYISEGAHVIGWTPKGDLIYSSDHNSAFRFSRLYTINLETQAVERILCGPSNFISFHEEGKASVIQRHGYGYVSWKRYRGGTAGELWIDTKGNRQYKKLITLPGNILKPLWLKDRIYFISDHEGHGNIYSCTSEGIDLKRHTHHEDFFVRGLNGDGNSLIYVAGSEVYLLDLLTSSIRKLDISHNSSVFQRNRKFVDPTSYLSSYSLDQKGTNLAVISRGRAFSFSNWEGAVHQHGDLDGIRYKHALWLYCNKRLLIVSDRNGKDCLEIHDRNAETQLQIFDQFDLGRVTRVKASPLTDEIILTNHRCELIHINLKKKKLTLIEKSSWADIQGFDWSPDGKWIAYDYPKSHQQTVIKLCELKTFKTHEITKPILADFKPSFDPEGKYLYFLSKRIFTPYHDKLQFELGFAKGTKPYLITLQKDLASPFIPQPSIEEEETPPSWFKKGEKKASEPKPFHIDLEGITERIVEFPVHEADYVAIAGIPGKAIYLSRPFEKSTNSESSSFGLLEYYEFSTQKEETISHKVSSFTLSADKQYLSYLSHKRLRVIKAGEKPQDNDSSYKRGGWIDLSRIRISIDTYKEWEQIFNEVWRLQKEFFWTEDMSKIDWDAIYKRYRPLLNRVATRTELSDLIAEMHGELGSSHAYVFGGDYRESSHHPIGELAADLVYDTRKKGYKFTNMATGDLWQDNYGSPLKSPGLNITENDVISAINGIPLSKDVIPSSLLVNQAHNRISLTLKTDSKKTRVVHIKTLESQIPLRYRDWIEKNRKYVHDITNGEVGYIHVPDMSVQGFSEFHRGFLSEFDRHGLIVDIRFNRGGNISPLLLEKLGRRRLGFDQTRWYGSIPYPMESPVGPMVALANEYTASDGDIFSQSFKMLKLGPLIGKRTWGGVIGIWPRHNLVDGGATSQPEFSFWFNDSGWAIENYGVTPDIEVEITPQEYEQNKDPQLDRGIEEVLKRMKEMPLTRKPSVLSERPNLLPPKLVRED